ncbi:UDP-N-acetylmuramate--L-alanine ligase [Occallatibacter riparius]|uniref:UDP-N-acetylmuramate--L-alanine ligase n=1 Tax=Occallatibacter riparius TaxID=1002689 RepID=A0A9J7BHY3_9BACT|nr:UDP-N-acetylmuramate--L-alanine ligase [Occallatibacter riparius]UWZ82113.1 UDP-N-acetylmuramate--L-alanine ligase [Occallatibacter riparius]
MFATSQHAHFIGIGGIGMSGIAEILLNQNMKVSGSDLRRTPVTDRLAALGAIIYEGHEAGHVGNATVVVTSSAVHADNPEVQEARARKIPVIQRAEMLAELMRLKYGIAIAGMHGKTTTTSMVASVLSAGQLDPTVVVGGRVDALGSNARLGTTQYLVAEADESDRSFLKLSPILAVVTNLDREHMDTYGDMEDVERAFLAFMDRVPFYGAVTACLDNPQLAAILPRAQRRVFTYGVTREADYRLEPLAAEPGSFSRFQVFTATGTLGPFELHVPGRHNVLNATAAVAIGHQLGVTPDKIAEGLRNFRGVDRRFQHRGSGRGVAVVDDYGHHPTEIRATLAAARECGYKQVHVVFQPHRYTRTADLMDEFSGAFTDADTVFVLPIYAASEQPIQGVTAERLAHRIEGPRVQFVPDFPAAIAAVTARAEDGDLIMTLGAGSVSQLAPQIVEKLSAGS